MNRYYLVLLKLYKESLYKRTMKEIWGNKIRLVYGIFIGAGLTLTGFVFGLILILINNKNGGVIIVVSYVFLIIIAILALFLAKANKDDIKQREIWLKEIDRFNSLLIAYEFGEKDIELMISYIDEYRTKKFERGRRKYDVLWGFISVTVFSFMVSVGKSIWDSYGFIGNEALSIGLLVFILVFFGTLTLLMLISIIYDSVVKVPKDEEGVKKALQEVLFRRSVQMIVTVDKISNILIEDDTDEDDTAI